MSPAIMDFIPVLVLVCVTVLAWFHVKSKSSRKKYPPGPFPFPIIGNILQLGRSPHISLANLSTKYGPLMYLKLGARNTIVASSPEMAKLVLQKHDQVLSGRTVPLAGHVYDFHKYTMGLLPAGDQWRNLRKICNEHMYATSRLDSSQDLRQEKLNELRDFVRKCCDEGRVINIGEAAFTVTLSLMWTTMFSYDLGGVDSESARGFREKIQKMLQVLGAPNVADFFPFLEVFDPQRIMPIAKKSYGKLIEFLQEIVDQRSASRSRSNNPTVKNDFLDELICLSQETESEFSYSQIKFLLLTIREFHDDYCVILGPNCGCNEHHSASVEWAMAQLQRNPEKMSKLKCELDAVVGGRDKLEESDISKLPYLQAVVKETLRLHPATPFLVPHKAEAEVQINGYTIPKNAQVLVNVWAIGRDSSAWPNPNLFEPERFLESEINYKGQNFELLPFGSGRRMCPGIPLAYRMVHLMLATLIKSFDWKLQGGKPEEIDLDERFGLTLEKFTPLHLLPIKH